MGPKGFDGDTEATGRVPRMSRSRVNKRGTK